jgi:hypothetical protein
MKLNNTIQQTIDGDKSAEEIADYIMDLKEREDRKKTIQRIEKLLK